jgi:signal transduction histidine kinase
MPPFNYPTELIEELPFSITARVAMQLGRESISNSIVAILELIKNAYDADAEKVSIHFAHLGTPNAIMVIEDDGLGMSEAQLSRRWLLIGTEFKHQSSTSKEKGRIVTGEKGLGRLGLDRLCTKTMLRSFTKSASRGVELHIDWNQYDRHSNSRLEEVKHRLYRIDKRVPDPITEEVISHDHGTQITLQGLKDTWVRDQIKELRSELTLLISPFAGINDFQIEVSTGGWWKDLDGVVTSSELLDVAEWHVRAGIADEDEHSVSFAMDSSRFKEAYSDPARPWKERFPNRGGSPQCGPIVFEFYFFPREKVELRDLAFKKAQIETFLDSNQGIRIYRDGFRVKPYGNPDGGGDWLNLSFRRMQQPAGVKDDIGTWRVGYNQIVGAVFISREKNPKLIDQTNREGIVEEQAFYDLRVFARRAIEFFEIKRQEFEKKEAQPDEFEAAKEQAQRTSEESQVALQDLRSSTHAIQSLLADAAETETRPDIKQIADILTRTVSNVAETVEQSRAAHARFEEAAKQQAERLQRQKDTLGNLASLGILTASFGHETIGSANVVHTNAAMLKTDLEGSAAVLKSGLQPKVQSELSFLLEHSERIETFARFTLANIRRDKRTRKPLPLGKIVTTVFKFFKKPLEDKHIEVQLDIPETIPTLRGFEIDWESILINLISNAVWAMEDTPAEQRKIRVRMRSKDAKLDIYFADSGKGLEAATEDKIFLPTFSTKRNAKGEVIGTGMGLAIVKGFVEDYPQGSVTVESSCDIGGAEFHISVGIPGLTGRDKRMRGE